MRASYYTLLLLIACGSPTAKRETASSAPIARWAMDSTINAIDDSRTVVLRLSADAPSPHGVAVILRCESGKLQAYVNWNQYLGIDTVTVTDRVGSAPARTNVWSLSTDYKAAFSPRPAFFLATEIADSGRYVVQTTPYGESPQTATFTTTGLRAVLPTLFAHCPSDTVTVSYPNRRVADSVMKACAMKPTTELGLACLDAYQRRRNASRVN